MQLKKWTVFLLFYLLSHRTLATATPAIHPYPQAVPPVVVTGWLGVIHPKLSPPKA